MSIQITEQNFNAEVLQSALPVVVPTGAAPAR